MSGDYVNAVNYVIRLIREDLVSVKSDPNEGYARSRIEKS